MGSLSKRFIMIIAILLAATLFVTACGGSPSNEQNQPGQQQTDTEGPAGEEPKTGTGKTVRFGYVNWAEAVAVTNMWKVILENEGYTVEMTEADAAPLFTGLAQGDVDFFFDAWLPVTHKHYFEEYGDDIDKINVWYEGDVKIGLAVPTYVDVDSLDELNANKELFQGEIIGIDPGAGLMKATRDAIDEYPLDYELVASSEGGMLSALERAYGNEEPIVVTLWSPHWAFAKWDLKYLEDSKGFFGEPEEIHLVSRKGAADDLPEVVEMLKRFKMTDEQLSLLEAYIADDGMNPEEAGAKWIGENEDIVNGWLGK